ncbi:DUF4112 domain-containing protein [Alsobacter sp. R-9]
MPSIHNPAWHHASVASADVEESRRRLEALAAFLDSAIRVPGTRVTVGADALLNLVPGIGTAFAKLMAGYLVWEARRLGVPARTLARMTGNVAVDLVFSAIPVVGWVGDVFFRANRRNMDLLRRHLETASGPRRPSGASRRPATIDLTAREVTA